MAAAQGGMEVVNGYSKGLSGEGKAFRGSSHSLSSQGTPVKAIPLSCSPCTPFLPFLQI